MKKHLISILALSALFVLTTGCGGQKKEAVAEETKDETVKVRIATAVEEEIEDTGVFTSSIEPFHQNNIAPQQAARIDRILVNVGDRVSKGQLLATMDRSAYDQAAVMLANSETDFERMRKVYDAGGVSKQQLDLVESMLLASRTQAANLLQNVELRCPINGVVTARNFDPGDMSSAQVPIMVVMQIDMLKVTLSISERYFPAVSQGMKASITVDMYPGKVYEGKVTRIHPAIDPATRTFTIEIAIPNPTGELRPGMFSRTELKFGTVRGVMVDDVAIQRQAGTNDKFLFVDVNGVAERREIITGIQIGSRVQALTGVNPGDRVVVAGASRLMQGTALREE